MPTDRTSARSPRRRAAYTLIALLLPLALLAAVELVLRQSEAGALEPLFIRHPAHPEWSLANPQVVRRFFPDPEQAPGVSIETGFFRTEKADGALRLVVQGGSSAAGFPYGYGASVAGMLEQRLRREFPEREIEVVTTAMSAVNSYALLDFADEILAIRPDAVLIYAGHNEFLGVLGVGSAYTAARSPALTRLVLQLRRLRIYRLAEVALSPAPAPAAEPEGPLMARVAAERRIPMDSAMYRAGVEQFRSNVSRLLARYREAGVPVFIATPASNERDQPPFASSEPQAARATLRQAAASSDLASARRAVEAVLAEHPDSATGHYRLAGILSAAGSATEAAAVWRRARDLDELRFRAPTEFEALLRETAAENGARLVDAAARFRAASPQGAVGGELMLEHVHPNVDGYFLLADGFHDALLEAGIPGPAARGVADSVARAEVPLSQAEIRFGQYKLMRLKNDWPFTDAPRETVLPPPAGLEDQLAQSLYRRELDWPRVQDRLKRSYRAAGRQSEYLRLALILADAFPFVAEAQRDAGAALLERGRAVQAYRYLHRAVSYAPDDAPAWRLLAQAADRIGLAAEASRARARLEALQSG